MKSQADYEVKQGYSFVVSLTDLETGIDIDSSNVYLRIEDVADPDLSTPLNGLITSTTGKVLDDAVIKGFDTDGNEVNSTISNSAGKFRFVSSEELSLTIEKDFTNDNVVTVRDALDALKLSIGMTKSDGTINPLDFIAADMNEDGKVSVRDALDILKYSLNMESSQAHWKFISAETDLSGLSRSSVTYESNMPITFYDLPYQSNFFGILVGDVNGSF